MEKKTVIFAGEAGKGIDRTAVLFSRMLTASGIHAFVYRDYSSLIRGGHNFSVVSLSDQEVNSHSEEADIIVAFDASSVNIHRGPLKTGGIIITAGDFGVEEAKILAIDGLVSQLGLPRNFGNNAILGVLADIFEISDQAVKEIIEESFKEDQSESVMKIVKAGRNIIDEKIFVPRTDFSRKVIDGNEAIAKGACDAGLEIAFYYPMTPATGVFSKLIEIDSDIIVEQMEDEIAVANAGIGASYAGATTLIGSSGGGLALMGEVVSLAGMAEVPLVIYAAQRLGPSTGVPTYTAQGDLRFIMHMGPGEFPRVVLVPGDTREAYRQTIEAFYWARKYRIPAFIVSDKHLAESYFETEELKAPSFAGEEFIDQRASLSYQITEDGLSPRAIPGGENLVRGTSYEHDESGYTVEDTASIKAMNEKRYRKQESLKLEAKGFERVKIYGEGKKILIVSTGSTKGAIIDALKQTSEASFLQILYLDPFPSEEVLEELKKYERVILVENNLTGPLGGIIREKTGVEIEDKILKYDGRPFTAEEIIGKLK